jgi:hypothetical protein
MTIDTVTIPFVSFPQVRQPSCGRDDFPQIMETDIIFFIGSPLTAGKTQQCIVDYLPCKTTKFTQYTCRRGRKFVALEKFF